jgi:hypothetical protein
MMSVLFPAIRDTLNFIDSFESTALTSLIN